MKNPQKSATTKTCTTIFKPPIIIAVFILLLCALSGCSEPSTVEFTTMVVEENEADLKHEAEVAVGETLSCQIKYTNLSPEPQTGIVIWAELPDGITFLDNTTCYYDAAHENGIDVTNDVTEGIQIEQCAGYDPDSGATKGETVTITFSVYAVSASRDGNPRIADIVGKIKTPTALCEDKSVVTIVAG